MAAILDDSRFVAQQPAAAGRLVAILGMLAKGRSGAAAGLLKVRAMRPASGRGNPNWAAPRLVAAMAPCDADAICQMCPTRAAGRGLAAPTAAGGPEQLVDPLCKCAAKHTDLVKSKWPANTMLEA